MMINTGQTEDYENVSVQEKRQQLGPFVYDDHKYEMSLGQRDNR